MTQSTVFLQLLYKVGW